MPRPVVCAWVAQRDSTFRISVMVAVIAHTVKKRVIATVIAMARPSWINAMCARVA